MKINKINTSIIFKGNEKKEVVIIPKLKPVPEDQFIKEKKDEKRTKSNNDKYSEANKSADNKNKYGKDNHRNIRWK